MDIFQKKLFEATELCNSELADRRNGILGESTEDQLENYIIPELCYISSLISSNRLPKKQSRFITSFALAFKVWGWNMQNPTKLFLLLAELNSMYKNLKWNGDGTASGAGDGSPSNDENSGTGDSPLSHTKK